MMHKLKLIRVGDSVGVALPEEILAALKLKEGDVVYVTEIADGLVLTPHNLATDEQLSLGREIMRNRREVLRALAKT